MNLCNGSELSLMVRFLKLKPRYLMAPIFGACMLVVAGCSSPEEQAQAHYEKGVELLSANQPAKARLEFLNAIKLNDKLTSAWFNLAKIDETNRNWGAVGSNLARVLELDPDHFEAHLSMAKLSLSARQHERALEHINRASELKSGEAEVHATRAGILLRLNDRDGARKDAQKALSIEEGNADALTVLAADQMTDSNVDGALEFVNRGLKADPDHFMLLLFSMRLYEQKGEFGEVEAVLRKLQNTYPENKRFRQALVTLFLRTGNKEGAETEMRSLVAAFPDDNPAALRLVALLESLKGKEAARSELIALIEKRSSEIDLKIALAQFDFLNKGLEAARETLDPIVQKKEPPEHARRARLHLAKLLLASKNGPDALALIEEVLSGDERNTEALRLRAAIRISRNEIDNAISDLREALSQEPESVGLLQLLGTAFERKGSLELAQERYAQAVRAANFDPRVTIRFVQFLRARGKIDVIETTLSDALVRRPNNIRLLQMLGQVRLQKQDWVGAQEVAATLSKLGDKSSVGEELLGSALLGQRKVDESALSFARAIDKNPNSARPLFSLVALHLKSGNVDEAEKLVQSVLDANDKNAEAHVLAGAVKATQNKTDEVEAAYRRAIESQPRKAIGYVALGSHLSRRQKTDQAGEVFQEGFDNSPGDLRLALALAGHLQIRGDIEGAIDIYERHLKAVPRGSSPIILNNLASLLSDFRDDQASLDRAAELAKLLRRVEVPQFKDTIGWIAYRRGEYKEAAVYLEEAVAKLPELALARYHLGLTYAALGRTKDASDQLKKAEELNKGQPPLGEKIAKARNELPAAETTD